MDESNDPLWPRPPQSCYSSIRSKTFLLIISAIVGFSFHCFALSFCPGFSPIPASPPPTVFDILSSDSKYYGKPLVTIGTIPFGVKSEAILQQFLVSIGSWLRSSAQIVVHVYDVVDGMGSYSSALLERLQLEFGRERIQIRDRIIKKLKIETITEAFEIIEKHTESIFAAWFSTDMILSTDWMEYVYAAMQYFGEFTNYSMHFVRRDLFVSCRKDIFLDNITRTDWPIFFSAFRKRCLSRLHNLGYDCYLWNHQGINMTAAQVAPFFIGRPDFDGAIISKQMSLGWFVSTYRATETYHLEHPDRPQYTRMKKHPDSIYNRKLMMKLGGVEFVNEALDIRISLKEISERRNGTWNFWSLKRPKGAFPFGYPPERIESG